MNNAGRRMHERWLVWKAQGGKCADCSKTSWYNNEYVHQVLDKNKRVAKMVCSTCNEAYTQTHQITPEQARAELEAMYTPTQKESA